MAVPKRLAPITLIAVALALTLTGVIYAATDSNPAGIAKDPLALNGYPPKTGDFELKVSTGQAYSLNANVAVNFRKNSAQAQLLLPLLFSDASIDMRLVNGHLYVGSSNLSSIFGKGWIRTSVKTPSLFGISLELTKPDISLISGFSKKTITKSGYLTTYHYERNNVIFSLPSSSPVKMPPGATIDVAITVGSQGELTAATVSERSKDSKVMISLNVLSYNQPLRVDAPPSNQVKKVNVSILKKLLSETPYKDLFSPKYLGSLGKTQIS
jgi:hypothetical protein